MVRLRLDLMIFEVLSNLSNSMILLFQLALLFTSLIIFFFQQTTDFALQKELG